MSGKKWGKMSILLIVRGHPCASAISYSTSTIKIFRNLLHIREERRRDLDALDDDALDDFRPWFWPFRGDDDTLNVIPYYPLLKDGHPTRAGVQ